MNVFDKQDSKYIYTVEPQADGGWQTSSRKSLSPTLHKEIHHRIFKLQGITRNKISIRCPKGTGKIVPCFYKDIVES